MRSRGQSKAPARAGRKPSTPARQKEPATLAGQGRAAKPARSSKPASAATPARSSKKPASAAKPPRSPKPARAAKPPRPARQAVPADATADDAAFLGQRFAAVYQVVRRIPPGRVLTYGQVAELAGMPGAARAVGAAMRASSPDLGLPWQRVVGKRGPSTGLVRIHDPMGAGVQRALLEAEGVTFTDAAGISLTAYGWVPATPPEPPPSLHPHDGCSTTLMQPCSLSRNIS
jgi:methylated-DNA-protein-cysteine methyltransferase-like protein